MHRPSAWAELLALVMQSFHPRTNLDPLRFLIREIEVPHLPWDEPEPTLVDVISCLVEQLPDVTSIGIHSPLVVRNLLRAASVHSTLTSLSVTVSTHEHIRAVNFISNLLFLEVAFLTSPESCAPDVIQETVGFYLPELQSCGFNVYEGSYSDDGDPLPVSMNVLQVIAASRLPTLRSLTLSPGFSVLSTEDPCTLDAFIAACKHLSVVHAHGYSFLAFNALRLYIPRLDLLSIKDVAEFPSELLQNHATSNTLPACLSLECGINTVEDVTSVLSFLVAIGKSDSGLAQGFNFIVREHFGLKSDQPGMALEEGSSYIDTGMSLFYDLDPQYMWTTLPPFFWATIVRTLQQCRVRLGARGVEMSWRLKTKDSRHSCSSHKQFIEREEDAHRSESAWGEN